MELTDYIKCSPSSFYLTYKWIDNQKKPNGKPLRWWDEISQVQSLDQMTKIVAVVKLNRAWLLSDCVQNNYSTENEFG